MSQLKFVYLRCDDNISFLEACDVIAQAADWNLLFDFPQTRNELLYRFLYRKRSSFKEVENLLLLFVKDIKLPKNVFVLLYYDL